MPSRVARECSGVKGVWAVYYTGKKAALSHRQERAGRRGRVLLKERNFRFGPRWSRVCGIAELSTARHFSARKLKYLPAEDYVSSSRARPSLPGCAHEPDLAQPDKSFSRPPCIAGHQRSFFFEQCSWPYCLMQGC